MKKICLNCGSEFEAKRKDKIYCSKECKWQYRNDRKPRLTNKSYLKAKETRKRPIPPDAKQVIIGGLLGDGCLVKSTSHYRFSMCHAESQREYMEFKRNLLGDLIQQDKPNEYSRGRYRQLHYHSISHPELDKFHSIVYQNGIKTVSKEWLNMLEPLGLSIWYLDDGSYNSNPRSRQMSISTDNFGLEGNELIADWFQKNLGFKPHISRRNYATTFSKAKVRYRLVINRSNVPAFIEPFYDLVPHCMRYKLPSSLPC